jgi:hypothetical protein
LTATPYTKSIPKLNQNKQKTKQTYQEKLKKHIIDPKTPKGNQPKPKVNLVNALKYCMALRNTSTQHFYSVIVRFNIINKFEEHTYPQNRWKRFRGFDLMKASVSKRELDLRQLLVDPSLVGVRSQNVSTFR